MLKEKIISLPNQLDDLNGKKFKGLEDLTIKSIVISCLRKKWFNNLKNLEKLNIRSNNINEI